MPIEVIDLLSSPDTRRLPNRKHPPNQVVAARDTRGEAAAFGIGAFDSSEDGTLPLIEHNSVLQKQITIPTGSKRTVDRAERHEGVIILSDDFDESADVDDQTRGRRGDGPSKRARTSPRTISTSTYSRGRPEDSFSSLNTRSQATILQPADARKSNLTIESIELTSSLDNSHLPVSKKLANKQDDDPFASSSPGRWTRKDATQPTKAPIKPDEEDPFGTSPAPPNRRAPKALSLWDPISSSAPEPVTGNRETHHESARNFSRSRSQVIELDESADDFWRVSSGDEFPEVGMIDSTAEWANAATKKRKPTAPATRISASSRQKTSKTTVQERDRDKKERAKLREAEKEERAMSREAEKERKKQEKQAARDLKAAEKERSAALAEVNKIRTDKKVSTPEMIVDLPSTIDPTLELQVQTLLRDCGVQHHSWDAPLPNVVKWRRKVSSRFNDNLGHWEPIPLRIESEKHALVIIPANEFVRLVLSEQGADLEDHVQKMKQNFADCTLIYLIEGLTAWMRKNRNVRNREFTSAVRSLADETETTTTGPASQEQFSTRRRRKDKPPQAYIDEDSVEDALLGLQVTHSALIHHTAASVETAQWIAIFTQHMSTIPYRRQRERLNDGAAAFCMDTGQVRTGDGASDTYVRMLQEIARVTAPIAYGVAAEYASVSALVRGLQERGPLALEECRKSANKDGAFSDRAIGQAVSRRIYKVFTGRDESSTDI